MTFKVGDRVVAEAESTERRPRAGSVLEWDDGHESIYTPAAGALHAERGRAGATS
jgi:hypothetical protein